MYYPPGVSENLIAELAKVSSVEYGPVAQIRDIQSWQVIAKVQCATRASAVTDVLRARGAIEMWENDTAYSRSLLMMRFLRKLLEYEKVLIGLNQVVSGKSYLDSHEEFSGLIFEIDGALKVLRKLRKPRRGGGRLPFSKYRVMRHPVGVVGVYSRRGYALQSVTRALMPLLGGNTVVSFVSPQTALCTHLLRALLISVGLHPDVWRIVVSNDHVLNMSLIPGLDYVSVAGRQAICERVQNAAQQVGVPVASFAEAKTVAVVMDDAKMWNAAKAIARSAFQNAGQASTSVEVVFVKGNVQDHFAGLLAQYTRDNLRVGTSQDPCANVGALLEPIRVQRLEQMVAEDIAYGASVRLGSQARPEMGANFFESTILLAPQYDGYWLKRRYHGPVVVLVPFTDLAELIKDLNAMQNLHLAALFTRNMRLAAQFIELVPASGVVVNDVYQSLYSTWDAPIQGYGSMGEGIRHGIDAVHQFTRINTAFRVSYLSWVPRDWGRGNWYERISHSALQASQLFSIWASDPVRDGFRLPWRVRLRDWWHGPV